MDETSKVKEQLASLLLNSHAHMNLSDAVRGFPVKHINDKPSGVSYSFWQLLEHIRITQADILEFSINPKYVYLKWPDDYWPKGEATASMWKNTINEFEKDLKKFVKLVKSPKSNLYTPFPWGEGQTLLKEALVIADHNSYHIGEFAILRGSCNLWGKTKH